MLQRVENEERQKQEELVDQLHLGARALLLEDFVRLSHKEGGVVSVRTCMNHLKDLWTIIQVPTTNEKHFMIQNQECKRPPLTTKAEMKMMLLYSTKNPTSSPL